MKDDTFLGIYDVVFHAWGRASALFRKANVLEILNGSEKWTPADLDNFIKEYCTSHGDEKSNLALQYRLKESATERAKSLRPDGPVETPADATAEVNFVEPVDAMNLQIPKTPQSAPTAARLARPNIGCIMAEPDGKTVEHVAPKPPPKVVPPAYRDKVSMMSTGDLLSEMAMQQRKRNTTNINVCKALLQMRDDMPGNPYYVPRRQPHPQNANMNFVSITADCVKWGFSGSEHVMLQEAVYDHLRLQSAASLNTFIHMLTQRKLMQDTQWEPKLDKRVLVAKTSRMDVAQDVPGIWVYFNDKEHNL